MVHLKKKGIIKVVTKIIKEMYSVFLIKLINKTSNLQEKIKTQNGLTQNLKDINQQHNKTIRNSQKCQHQKHNIITLKPIKTNILKKNYNIIK
jgi:hypothetical protein